MGVVRNCRKGRSKPEFTGLVVANKVHEVRLKANVSAAVTDALMLTVGKEAVTVVPKDNV